MAPPLDSFFLHDSAGTERCEDAIRAESISSEGAPTTYLSVAYCLGTKEKTFILGAHRTSIVHIYKYIDHTLSCTYTALCPVRTEFGCWLNAYDGVHGREKELTLNNKVAQSPDFDRDHYSLDFVKEYSRQAAHIMMDTKKDSTHPATIHSTKTHHTTIPHTAAPEGYFDHYDIACHMANIAACPNGLSERLYRRGIAALLEKQTMADQLSYASAKTCDGYTSDEESDTSISSHKGKSAKESAGQIMRVCAFNTDFLITSWDKRDITSALTQAGIDIANGRCIVDEKWPEFYLIKSVYADFTGIIPYFFDDEKLFRAVYERKLNYSTLWRLINSPKRKMAECEDPLVQTIISGAGKQLINSAEKQIKKRRN